MFMKISMETMIVCQFLIGKVQQIRTIGGKTIAKAKSCQFLIGKVQLAKIQDYLNILKANGTKCQFLIGKVQHYKLFVTKTDIDKLSSGVNSS